MPILTLNYKTFDRSGSKSVHASGRLVSNAFQHIYALHRNAFSCTVYHVAKVFFWALVVFAV